MAEAKRWLTRRRLIAAAVALPILIVGWWLSAYPRGMLAAWFDHSRGHFEVQTFGYRNPWAGEYHKLIQTRYGVKVNAVAGCVVTEKLVWYVDGYNSVSRPRIVARQRKDIFAECAEEAQSTWEAANPRE